MKTLTLNLLGKFLKSQDDYQMFVIWMVIAVGASAVMSMITSDIRYLIMLIAYGWLWHVAEGKIK